MQPTIWKYKTIWKYELNVVDEQIIDIPEHRKFLSVQIQKGTPCMWFLVDPDSPKVPVAFNIFGTGELIEQFIGAYHGTFQINSLVFHVFEK